MTANEGKETDNKSNEEWNIPSETDNKSDGDWEATINESKATNSAANLSRY